jgi:hypothetical protein
MASEIVKQDAGDSTVRSPLDRREGNRETLGHAFPSDREPQADELAVDMGDVRQVSNYFFRSKGPLFAACWLLNNFATAQPMGGDATKVPYEDMKDRMKGIFRNDDNFDSYIQAAHAWYKRLHGTGE